mgnify:CR=1 FL=1
MQTIKNGRPTSGIQSNVTASDIAFELNTQIDSEFYDVLYPDKEWYKIVSEEQIYSNINPGASNYAYMSRSRHGAAAFIGHGVNNDIPMVGQSIGAVTVPIAYAAVGAEVTNEDARQYTFGMNGNLAQELGTAMREACDNLIENSVIFGVPDLGFHGWINYPGITVMTASQSAGTPASTKWQDKTGIEIAQDINSALTYAWENSKTIFKPSTIFLPLQQYSMLANTPMVLGNGGNAAGVGLMLNILNYVKANNIISEVAGKELEILPSRYLAGAGVGGTDRMVVMDRRKENQILPFPLPYQLSEPQPKPLAVAWFAENKFGSYHVRQQGSMLYVDGI